MRIATVLGTRPEIIRLSRIIPKLDQAVDHVLIHTGQNFDTQLSDVFFRELGVRAPDVTLKVRESSVAQQIGSILAGVEREFSARLPDRLLVLGDTNSALSAFIAKRMGIPVFHMEAGNRCYDDRVPEEVNRRVIDHSSDVLMPYTERSRTNLLREGIAGERIFVTGNPIREVLLHHEREIAQSGALEALGVKRKAFLLVTLHRAENVDIPERLAGFVEAFHRLAGLLNVPVIVSTHPRTRQRLGEQPSRKGKTDVRFVEPFGLFDFIRLEREAKCVLTDSGTVQEECAIFGVPNVTLRDVTERPETVERGSNLLTGGDPEVIVRGVETALRLSGGWSPPAEYLATNVSDTIIKIVTSHYEKLPAAGVALLRGS